MANKRMFSIKIIDTDLFLDMPVSTRLLYYDLAMRADDDGFVGSPKKITKMVGCSEDDLKLLCVKQFLIPFDSGVCVIKDWKIHNTIQKDRYSQTQFLLEKDQLNTDFSGSYCLGENQLVTNSSDCEETEQSQLNTDFNGTFPSCIQSGNSLETQTRLDKIRLEQDKIRLDITPITNYFEENIGLMSNSILTDVMFFLDKAVEQNLIIACLDKAVYHNAKFKWNYAKGILNNLLTTGVVTLEAFQAKESDKNGSSKNAKHSAPSRRKLTGVTEL